MIPIQKLIEMMSICEVGQCVYLSEQKETLRAMRCPDLPNALHSQLMECGFRHSHDVFYLSACQHCHRCIPMRIDPRQFKPSKKQRHIFNINAGMEISINQPLVTDEKYDIYRRYMDAQHSDSPQGNDRKAMEALYVHLPSSAEIQYRLNGQLVGISLTDIIPESAFSSVYHFFDPTFSRRSIGTFSMIAEIKLCQLLGIPYYYPGLWVPGCRKMHYKSQFQPAQIFIDGEWGDLVMTQRMSIRPASNAEMQEMIECESDPVMKAAYSEMLDGCLKDPKNRTFYTVWLMMLNDDPWPVVGDLSFKGISDDGQVEIGYGLQKPFEGCGYMTEAVLAMTKWALKHPNVSRVEAETEADNAASQRVLLRCGFVPTGKNGEEGPRFVFSGDNIENLGKDKAPEK